MDVNALQFLNTPHPETELLIVTMFDKSIVDKLVHSEKHVLGIVVTLESNVIFVKEEHPRNTSFPMLGPNLN